ncbi:MAG: valine--tRNA ligase [Armatimonadetes bacterium]|nr:valine--tRNA ligase [Armatimonadota bacterium]
MAELPKTYDPHAVEQRLYPWWETQGWFHADSHDARPPCCITIPPPNVTGTLHIGHALQHAIHDVLARWARMRGYNVCVVPGVDHAGIGTQIKVSQHLYDTTGQSPREIGREAWLEAAIRWSTENGGTILRQLRALGCAYDWRRERYTLDDGYYHAVLAAFRHFYERGWIYRGERMVNWCTTCGTVISDLEVLQEDESASLWSIRYPGLDGAPDVTVSTTRPETMLGDTAVAVNPRDPRWQAAIGRTVRLPLMDRPIPIVADDYADPEFGSGAVKVTPGHDPNDWEIGLRHSLPVVKVIGPDGRITAEGGRFAGMSREEARKQVLEQLEAEGLLVGREEHIHAIPRHDRCETVIEPLPMEQWFVSMRDMADAVLPWYREEKIRFVPDRFRESGIEWLENIRDWCISRQLWWGHRIPIYYGEDGRTVCAFSDEEARAAFGDTPFRQEEDVLDTWFSSALWPFAVLGWPDAARFAYAGNGSVDEGSLAAFHPTTWMITGRDILYLWVARMAMTAKEFVGEIPFQTVLVHPTIQTKEGRRMSRSLGTGIDPLELIRVYGADATRLMLLFQCSPNQDIRFDAEVKDNQLESSFTGEMCRNFCNKVWNASRFVLMNLGDERSYALPAELERLDDRWILGRYQRAVTNVSDALERYRFDEAASELYHFVWTEFCDWYIELSKPRLRAGDAVVRAVLLTVLEGVMRLLHPLAPFLSEEIWQQLGAAGEACMTSPWPEADPARVDDAAEATFSRLQDLVRAIRNLRVEANVGDRVQLRPQIACGSAEDAAFVAEVAELAAALTGSAAIAMCQAAPPQSLAAVVGTLDVYLPLEGLVDAAAERERLGRELEKARKELETLRRKLDNESFVTRAPAEVVGQARARAVEAAEVVARLERRLASLGDGGS